ncbi:MAG: hypothetical protein HY340_02425 [Candidatus Kerfeldbacteria bacterium]|nr:hypothetical protein [Candidatus Kerfeldbacteria bacterium]
MDTHGIILLIIAALEFALAVYLFLTRSKGHVIYSYALFILSVTIWVLGNGLYRIIQDDATAFVWVRVLYFASVLIAITFVYFSLSFPHLIRPIRLIHSLLLVAPALVFLYVLFFTNSLVSSISGQPGIRQLSWGPFYHVFALWFMLYFGWGIVNLLKRLPLTSGFQYWQLKTLLTGIIISAVIGTTFNLILPWFNGPQLFFLGTEGSSIWLGVTSYIVFSKRAT